MNPAIEALITARIIDLDTQIDAVNQHITVMAESLASAQAEQDARIAQRDAWAEEKAELYLAIHGEDEETDDDTE